MNTVTISTKYQVVIPKEIREKLKLKPRKKLQIFSFDDRIEVIIPKNIKDASVKILKFIYYSPNMSNQTV